MTTREAKVRAAELGMSAWVVEAVAVEKDGSQLRTVKCVGFAGIELSIGAGETWDDAFGHATRIIFST
jgi:hypothetical protein